MPTANGSTRSVPMMKFHAHTCRGMCEIPTGRLSAEAVVLKKNKNKKTPCVSAPCAGEQRRSSGTNTRLGTKARLGTKGSAGTRVASAPELCLAPR